MSKTQYLQQLGHSWYVRVKVPAALQGHVGNTHIRRALGTRDLDEAVRLKWSALAQIRAHLEALAGRAATPARELRLLSLPGAPAASHAAGGPTELHCIPIAIDCNFSAVGDLQSIAKADGVLAEPCLDALLDKWLGGSDFVRTTKYQRRQAYGELRAFLGADVPPGVVTSALAAEYVDEQLRPGPGSASTKRRKLSGLSAFWEWLGSRRIVPHGFNPWRGLRLGRSAERTSPRKRPYTMDELARLFSGNPTFPALREVMVLGLYTGARVTELCSLTQSSIRWDADAAFVRIGKSKTDAGLRTLAVSHPIPVAVLRGRWSEGAVASMQLFPELKGGGYDAKLSWRLAAAFRRHRDGMGFSGETDFHSLRRTFITRMENLSVDQVRIARYVGHQLPTLAFTVYSGGSTENTQKETGAAISYPRDVEDAVRLFLAK